LMIILVWLVFAVLGWLTLPNLYKKQWYRELATVAVIMTVNLFLYTWLAWGKNLPEINTAITNLIKTWL